MKIIGWWSGGVTSAAACKLAADIFGIDNMRFIFFDTKNEDGDTYRFMKDCEQWYGKEITTLTALGDKFSSIQDVWYHFNSLNVAHGAICSSTLKRDLRIRWEKENEWDYQVFGFDWSEFNRAKSMKMNYPDAKPIFPLLMYGITKEECITLVENNNIKIPKAYQLGFHNNNCLNTGCVQGGIGYWQKMKRDFPEKFENMAKVEHDLTDRKGEPVTMCKDQSKGAKNKNEGKAQKVFLKPHPDYPNVKDISMMKGREPKPLMECNGFGCAVNDLMPKNHTQHEINFEDLI